MKYFKILYYSRTRQPVERRHQLFLREVHTTCVHNKNHSYNIIIFVDCAAAGSA